jgi:hypothetical protein
MNWATVKVHEINLLETSDIGMFMKVSMYAPLLILPISFTTAELQDTYNGHPTKFTIKDFKTGYLHHWTNRHFRRILVEVEPNAKLLFTGHDGLNLDFERAKFEFPDPEGVGEFINEISEWAIHGSATDPPTLQIEGKGDVFCMGIPVRNVDFYREQSIEMAIFGKSFLVSNSPRP